MENTQLKNRIMGRVRRVYYLKKIINPLALKGYAIVVAFFGIASIVSVQNTLANMPSIVDVSQFVTFALGAFNGTEAAVQGLIVIATLAALWAVRDIVRNFSHHSSLATVRA